MPTAPTEFDTRYNARHHALASIGLGDLDAIVEREKKRFAKFTGEFSAAFLGQLHYDLFTNLPCGVMTREEIKGHALRTAVVSALTSTYAWDVDELREFCAAVLEDANDHDTAALLRQLNQ